MKKALVFLLVFAFVVLLPMQNALSYADTSQVISFTDPNLEEVIRHNRDICS